MSPRRFLAPCVALCAMLCAAVPVTAVAQRPSPGAPRAPRPASPVVTPEAARFRALMDSLRADASLVYDGPEYFGDEEIQAEKRLPALLARLDSLAVAVPTLRDPASDKLRAYIALRDVWRAMIRSANPLVGIGKAQSRALDSLSALADSVLRRDWPAMFIARFQRDRMNSVGGVGPKFEVVNSLGKTIKYVRVSFVPYNAVGDVVRSEIPDARRLWGQITGPIPPGESRDFTSDGEPWWYNGSIRCLQLTGIEVDFMDGTSRRYSGAAIAPLLHPLARNDCRVR